MASVLFTTCNLKAKQVLYGTKEKVYGNGGRKLAINQPRRMMRFGKPFPNLEKV